MNRLFEILFGLQSGFLSREGDLSLQFNPQWPGQSFIGAGLWNALLFALAVLLVIYVYRRDGRSKPVRIILGGLRLVLLTIVIVLLNRPILTLGQSRTEPSVLAVMVDDSVSMRVRDGGLTADNKPESRLEAAVDLLTGNNAAMMKSLAKKHSLRFYRFDRDAQPVGSYTAPGEKEPAPTSQPAAVAAIEQLKPEGQSTQVIQSVLSVLQDLQGQRVAGVVLLTDGRDTPARNVSQAIETLKNYGTKVYPVAVGSTKPPTNVEIQSVSAEETAFKGDIVNFKVNVRGSGYEANHTVKLVLKDKKTGSYMLRTDGSTLEETVTLPDDKPVEAELQWKADEVGTRDLVVEAVKQPGEVDDEDNLRAAQVSVLDAKIAVLFVEGYPRWEYRYLKNELIRDKSIDVSCLLTSADATFSQEGDKPIKRFPESIEEIMGYDVVVIGDVDPRYFTDTQLQLISEFVSRKGGGFAMIAGQKFSPQAYRNTAIEAILPVAVNRVIVDEAGPITQGFRPALTRVGADSSIFRFFAEKSANEKFIKDEVQPLFWYCRGATVKPGVGEVYAEHPNDTGPDGRKSPLLVLGRFGAGRTLFTAVDDTWRWRFYTGESIFDTYWVQQLRYLARGRKIGARRMTLASQRPSYEVGEQVRLSLRILDPVLLQQLPEQVRVEVVDANGLAIRNEMLQRQEGQTDLYTGSFSADRIGKFSIKLPPLAGGTDMMDVPVEVSLPRLELNQPEVDRTSLSRLASETLGQSLDLETARQQLPLIPSAAKVIPVISGQPLWDAPLTLAMFVLLIVAEWVTRKMYGMV